MSSYKTVQCYFFSQDRCLKGDKCTFKHGDSDPLAPKPPPPPPRRLTKQIPLWMEYATASQLSEFELCKRLEIETCTTYPCRFHYYIKGENKDCMKYYNEYILPQYPTNPYFTRIVTEDQNSMHVTRSTTCD
jgi:hypothetical protein